MSDVDWAHVAEAVEQLGETDPTLRLPTENPFTLDHLLHEDTNTLLNRVPPPA